MTFPRVSRRGGHFANLGDVIIYPDLVVARTGLEDCADRLKGTGFKTVAEALQTFNDLGLFARGCKPHWHDGDDMMTPYVTVYFVANQQLNQQGHNNHFLGRAGWLWMKAMSRTMPA